MCGRRALAGPPFAGRIRINPAELARFTRDDLCASFALIDDRQAASSVESTALLSHEAALDAAFDALTNHVYLLFSGMYGKSEKNRPALNPCSWPSGSVSPFFKVSFAIKIVTHCQEKNAAVEINGKFNYYR
jgi:hypothetical protein